MPAQILIVEDEQITAEDIRDILTELGYSVSGLETNGTDAITHCEQNPPDLVLMDIRIKGGMDGTETARILRERFNIPVVYLTAHTDKQTLDRAKLAEPLGYLTKPFKQGELQATIEIALHKHRQDVKSRAREHLLSSTLGAVGEGVLSLDRDRNITFMNPAAEAWTGWSAKEAYGKGSNEVLALYEERTRQPIHATIERVLGSGNIQELGDGTVLIQRGGLSQPVGGTISPIRNHHNQIDGVVIVFGQRNGGPGGSTSWKELDLKDEDIVEFGDFKMVVTSLAMKQLVSFARRVANTEVTTVLLEGESGTGKDVIARLMHHFGNRRDKAFVPLNCAAIPETLLESELFGYEKGAFTDAKTSKPGILEVASGGTVFLDEIGEMSLLLQAKMLRVLEEQKFRRLGGVADIHVDLRLVAASNRNLPQAVEQGTFRLDLYYRLNVIPLSLPPLRQRREDILPLARCFLQQFNGKFKRSIQGITTGAAEALLAYPWPGNIRELRNTVQRGVLLEDSEWLQQASLRLKHSGVEEISFQPGQPSRETGTLEQRERQMLMEALEKSRWNQTKAALLLGISRDTLRYKVKKFNLQPPQ